MIPSLNLFPRRRGFSLGTVLLLTGIRLVQAAQPTVSPEGAFVLNGPPTLSTLRFSHLLSRYEKQFYEVTGYSPSAALPVVVVLHDPETEPLAHPAVNMDAIEGNLPKIQVDLAQSDLLGQEASLALAQGMVLREYYAGKAPAVGSAIAGFPAWLLHGLGRLCNPDAPSVVIPSSFLTGGTPPSIEDFLLQKAPDDANPSVLKVYDAMAAVLLTAGFKVGDGGTAFREWIGNFDPMAPGQTSSNWPPRWTMQSVERRWLLLMAGMSGERAGVASLLSVEETLDRYDAVLAGVATPNHSLAPLKKARGGDFLTRQLSDQLIALRLEANPLTNPLLDQTIQLCARLKHLPTRKISENEKKLGLLREETLRRSRAIGSYLDWYEAAKLPVWSAAFDGLLNIPDSPVKKGPVGRYLDAIEERGW